MKKLKKILVTTMAVGMVMSQVFQAFADGESSFGNEYGNEYDDEYGNEYDDEYDGEESYDNTYSHYKNRTKCTEEEGDEILFDTDRYINVTFAGNSLLGEPKVDKYFKELVDRYQLNVGKVYDDIYYGQNIHFQLSVIDTFEYDFIKEDYEDSDVIVFQEYGYDYDTTLEDIRTLLDNYCKENTVAYYYTTQFDYSDDYLEEIGNDERIHVIDFGALFNELSDMYEETPYLHKADYHPNELAGFMAAGYIFTQMYKTVFTDYQYSELNDKIKGLIPGDNDTEKEEFYQQMLDVINRGVTNRDYKDIPMYVAPKIEKNEEIPDNKENESGKQEETKENAKQEESINTNEQTSDDKNTNMNTMNQATEVKKSEENNETKAAPKTGDSAQSVIIALAALLAGGVIAAKNAKRNSKEAE